MSVGICMRLMEDSETFSDKSKKRECQKSSVKSDEPAAVLVSMGPITPDSARDIGDFPIDFKSPITLLNNNKVASFDPNSDRDRDDEDQFVCIGSPRTPKDDVFDPFAPGPDDLALAPFCNKYLHVSKGIIARRLNFDFSSIGTLEEEEAGAQSLSDEEMLESVYENLLEVIVSKQTEGLLSGISHDDCDSDGFKTPPSAPRLSGVADTCPGAPMKPTGKPRKIDLGLCRKLDF